LIYRNSVVPEIIPNAVYPEPIEKRSMKNATCAKVEEKSPLNIAYVSPYLAERFGGPVTVVKNVGCALATAGHNVSYWSTSDGDDQDTSASLSNAHVYDLDWPRSWRRSKAFAKGLSAHISSFDIVHINALWLYSTYAASKIAKTNKVPYILCPGGTLQSWALRNGWLKWLKKKAYLNTIGNLMIGRAACLHACSAQEAKYFRQVGYRGPITIIPNGVDTNEFTGGDGSEAEAYWPELKNRPVLLFMSRLSPEKGLDILIPVWADLVKSPAYKDSILVIAGPDVRGYRKVVEGIIDRYNVGSQICMTGMVQGSKKLALLRRADIFVLPSYSENFGIVVAEALACGTPVITTTGTPWEQLQEVDAGRWVLPREAELARTLRELLNMSDSQRKAMGQRGQDLIKGNYTWDRIVDKFLILYNCVLSGTPVPLYP